MAVKIYGGEDNPLIQCVNPILDKWLILWNKSIEEESFSYMSAIFYHKPSLQEIKDVILNWYNDKIRNMIISGFTWKNNLVWLSMENLFNYTTSFTIASQSKDLTLPTFKLGTNNNPIYYTFKDLNELKDFYFKMVDYINTTLKNGWALKDSINWEEYSKILKEYEEI